MIHTSVLMHGSSENPGQDAAERGQQVRQTAQADASLSPKVTFGDELCRGAPHRPPRSKSALRLL